MKDGSTRRSVTCRRRSLSSRSFNEHELNWLLLY